MGSIKEIWDGVLSIMRQGEISQAAYDIWISCIEPRGIENGEMVVCVNTEFQKRTIETEYADKLRDALRQVLGVPIGLRVVSREVAAQPGVKALIFRSPCIALVKPLGRAAVDQEKCRKCRKCIREIGCPGIVVEEGKVVIDMSQCTGCGICAEICPFDAIEVTRLPGGGEPKRAQQGKGGRA